MNYISVEMLEEETQMHYSCRSEPAYDDCMYAGVTEMMRMGANCTVPWIRDNTSICTKKRDRNFSYWRHYNTITNQVRGNINMKKKKQLEKVVFLFQEGTCPSPCQFLIVNTGTANREVSKNNYSFVYLYFQVR